MIISQKSGKNTTSRAFFVFDTETYPDEQNADCTPFSVRFYPVSKISNSMVHRDLTRDKYEKRNKFKLKKAEIVLKKC